MLDCNGLVTMEVQQGQTKQCIGAARCRPFGTEPAGKKRGRGVGDGGRKSESAAEAAARHFCLFRTPFPPRGGKGGVCIQWHGGHSRVELTMGCMCALFVATVCLVH